MSSPTQRSLKHLRDDLGYVAVVVERWNQYAKIRQDFAGFADILAFKSGKTGVLAVQATTFGNRKKRVAKIQAEPRAKIWLEAGNQLEVHGWKRTKQGKRQKWELQTVEVRLSRNRSARIVNTTHSHSVAGSSISAQSIP